MALQSKMHQISTTSRNRLRCNPPRRTGIAVRAEPTTTVAAPAATDSQEEKINSTISTLDSLLGVPEAPAQPQPAPKPTPAASTSTPSISLPKITLPTNNTNSISQKKKGVNFEQVMGFSGYAPEVVNGRAAMLGFLAAISSELGNGESLWAQLLSGGAGKAAIVILAVTIASFAPAIRQQPMDKVFGQDKQPASFGPFTSSAELINGRAAMLGLLAMIFLEGASSQAFFM